MKHLALILGLATLATPALAAPISFTGAELANLPGSSFPTGGQTIVDDTLRFNSTTVTGVLYRLDLDNFIIDSSNIGISVNLDRLLNNNGNLDQDIRIGIYDGQNFFNTIFVDSNTAQQVQPRNRVDGLDVSETQIVTDTLLNIGSFNASPIGSVIQLDVNIQATPTSTTITSRINQNGATNSVSPITLNSNSGLNLIIGGDNIGENHLINSLTFTNGVSSPTSVAEPATLGGLAFGLMTLAFGLYRRRFG